MFDDDLKFIRRAWAVGALFVALFWAAVITTGVLVLKHYGIV